MARIDELVELVSDEGLRQELRSAVAEFRETKTFGLVFERHIPEGIGIPLPIRAGAKIRHKLGSDPLFVDEVRETTLVATDPKTDTQSEVPRSDYLVLRDFGEPIYPALRSVGGVAGVSSDRPVNAIINAENYHALQLLAYLYRGAVDCIYIDPPYNTGDRTWTYNNRFVDENDSNPHSKWLAFMERRLNLARKLLKPNGVLVVTTDEHEVLHLGMLLESLFKDAYRQMVTIVTNPKGVTRDRFSRVEEYALFVFFGTAGVSSRPDDLLTWGADEAGEGGEAAPLERPVEIRVGRLAK